ncbi:nitronate monooxygenase [Danxiaibacter flavus]|uniref:Propionate 3-nitronate monooxygenase n=1 Tax=Danxiaibacter flavus TaxID=3049108 RepID=A0ABV3ZIQ0_9BACT|nr:nitronate monooxygenase [Chitinophagaceae bacterium DXS]
MQWKNTVTDLLRIDYPIVQAPMLGVSTPEMVAAVSNAGGLGSLPVGGLSATVVADLIQKTRALTHKPFAVNLFAHSIPAVNEQEYLDMQEFLYQFAIKRQLSFTKQPVSSLQFFTWEEQIDILINEKIPVVSFTFGILSDEAIARLKNNGTILIGTATSLKEAQLLADKGIDIITAQGIEAGGHRGTFLHDDEIPVIGLMSLIPEIVDAVKKPVLAAGGIMDGKALRAAFLLGAKGVQAGSAFIACNESSASPSHKKQLINATDTDIILTKNITGRWARGIRNEIMRQVEQSALTVPPYPYQIPLTIFARNAGQKAGNEDLMVIWAGQSAFKAKTKSAEEIFATLVQEAEAI